MRGVMDCLRPGTGAPRPCGIHSERSPAAGTDVSERGSPVHALEGLSSEQSF